MWYLIAGIAGGVIGGLGMGGGTLLVPILTIMLGVSQKSAQLLNTLSFVPMAILSLILNTKKGLIKWKYILYVCPISLLGAIGGSLIMHRIDASILRICFGVFLVVLGVSFLIYTMVKLIRKKRSETLTSINVVKDEE